MWRQRLAQALVRPHVSKLFDFALEGLELGVSVEELRVVRSQVLSSLTAACSPDVIVVAIRKTEGALIFNPPPGTQLNSGDLVIAMGKQAHLHKLADAVARAL